MILLDTNILVYACVSSDARQKPSLSCLEEAASKPREYCLTWVNLFEYLRVVTHPKVLEIPLAFDEAFRNVRELASRLTLIHPGERHLDYVAQVAADLVPVRGDRIFDCRIAAILLENGGSRVLSYDTRLRRIRGLEVSIPGKPRPS